MITVYMKRPAGGALGFYDAKGSPFPSIERNEDFSLDSSGVDWSGITSIKLGKFQALVGGPWSPDPDPKGGVLAAAPKGNVPAGSQAATISSGQVPVTASMKPAVLHLATDSKFTGPRTIVFEVTVEFDTKTSFTYVDPWDERPGFP